MDFSCGFSYLKLLQITVNINVEILIHLLKMFRQHTEPGGRAEAVHQSDGTSTCSTADNVSPHSYDNYILN